MGEEPPGTYEICEVCGWEDDVVQYNDPLKRGGANKLSLQEAKQQYSNKNLEFKSVKEWFEFSYIKKQSSQPLSIDTSYFNIYQNESNQILKGINIYNELVQIVELEKLEEELMVVLVIPLTDVQKITFLPEAFGLNKDFSGNPCDIYLIQRDSEKYYDEVEEYKKNINFFVLNLDEKLINRNSKVYYRCFRYNHWDDYARAIYISHYSKRLLASPY